MAGVPAERGEHVAGVPHQDRAVANQREASGDLRSVDVARHRHHGDTAVGRPGGGVQGPAAGGRLNHDDPVRERRDDAVAGQELPRLRGVSGG